MGLIIEKLSKISGYMKGIEDMPGMESMKGMESLIQGLGGMQGTMKDMMKDMMKNMEGMESKKVWKVDEKQWNLNLNKIELQHIVFLKNNYILHLNNKFNHVLSEYINNILKK